MYKINVQKLNYIYRKFKEVNCILRAIKNVVKPEWNKLKDIVAIWKLLWGAELKTVNYMTPHGDRNLWNLVNVLLSNFFSYRIFWLMKQRPVAVTNKNDFRAWI